MSLLGVLCDVRIQRCIYRKVIFILAMWRRGARISILLVALKKIPSSSLSLQQHQLWVLLLAGSLCHSHRGTQTRHLQDAEMVWGVYGGGKHDLTAWAADRSACCTALLDGITPGVLLAHGLSADTKMWGGLPCVSAVMAGSNLEVLAGAPYLSHSRAEL